MKNNFIGPMFGDIGKWASRGVTNRREIN